VTDKQGLSVAAAQVHAEGVSIVGDRSATTDSNGEYRLPALPAGTYRLTVTRWVSNRCIPQPGSHAE
jgi:hypothetical protein